MGDRKLQAVAAVALLLLCVLAFTIKIWLGFAVIAGTVIALTEHVIHH